MRIERIATVVMVLALMGCGGKEAAEAEAGSPAIEVAATGPGDIASAAVGAAEGVATAASGKWPGTMPAFAPAYPGSTAEMSMSGTGGEGQSTIVGFVTGDSPDRVIAFYQAKAKAAGLSNLSNFEAGGARVFGASDDAGRVLSVQVSVEDGKTRGVVTAGVRPAG